MKISLQDPNQRLLIFLAAFIVVIGVLGVDRFLDPPAGSGIITPGLWLMLFGITGAILYSVMHFGRRPSTRFSHSSESDPSWTGSGNPWAKKANRALIIWCLGAEYEILVLMVLPVLFGSLADSGTIDLPYPVTIAVLTGVVAAFLVMIWSEGIYMDAVRWLDPDLVSGWRFYPRGSGPLFPVAMIIVVYSVFLGWFFSDLIRPFLISFLPTSVSPLFNPPLAGVTLALIAAPAIIFLVFCRRD